MATMYNSFYGGRRGASFVIAKSFCDILSMTTAFSRGNDYTEVAFDEYVLINNPLKKHPDNGKIFRRGYDINSDRKITATVVAKLENNNLNFYPTESLQYTSEEVENFKEQGYNFYDNIQLNASGAIYIGTIMGPAGNSPLLKLGEYDEVGNMEAETGFQQETSTGRLEIGESLLPGKVEDSLGNISYNDTIQYCACSIRNANYSDDTICYIGFKVPYLVTEWTTKAVEPYNSQGEYADTTKITEIETEDNQEHPFYKQYELSIPKGIKGQSLQDLRVVTESNLFSEENIRVYEAGTSNLYRNSGKNKTIIVYKAINYDQVETGEVSYYYLGDFNQITGIKLEDDGELTIEFSSKEDETFNQKIKWISNIVLNSDTNDITKNNNLKVNYNTGSSQLVAAPFIDDIKYNEDGSLTLHRVGSPNRQVLTTIRYVNKIEKSNNGNFLISYNNVASPTSFPFKEIKQLGYIDSSLYNKTINSDPTQRVVEGDNGKLYVEYTDGTIDFLTDSPLRNVSSIDFANGKLKFNFAEGTSQEFLLNPPKSFQYDIEQGTLQQIKQDDTKTSVGKLPLLIKLDVGSDLNLYAKFSINPVNDPETYQRIINMVGNDGTGNDIQHPSSEGWFRVGNVQHVVHPLIYKNITLGQLNSQVSNFNGDKSSLISNYLTQTSSYEAVIAVLNLLYPTGNAGENWIPGQVITIGESDQQKDFYAYSYEGEPRGWYFLGRIEKNEIFITESDNIIGDETIFRTVSDICNVTITIDPDIAEGEIILTNKMSHIQAGKDYINLVTILPSLSSYRIKAYVTTLSNSRQEVNVSFDPITKILKVENVRGDLEIVFLRGE